MIAFGIDPDIICAIIITTSIQWLSEPLVPWEGHTFCCCTAWFGNCDDKADKGTCEYGGGSSVPSCWFASVSLGEVAGPLAAIMLAGFSTTPWASGLDLSPFMFSAAFWPWTSRESDGLGSKEGAKHGKNLGQKLLEICSKFAQNGSSDANSCPGSMGRLVMRFPSRSPVWRGGGGAVGGWGVHSTK